ncbi:hypothetical protein FSP39_019420 [Pinctada imbricata]|uniref:Solute carrier family 28 member 3 n=1 Tax=Pinctada imbricata TaxID=66713 RepID=A0AA88YE40_PINIB|nr:hypothetical protein FSP39_019420 [Pinctada imbricata]
MQEKQNGHAHVDLTFKEPTFTENLNQFYRTHKTKLFNTIKGIILVLYLVYVGYSFSVKFGDEGSIRLLVCTLFGLLLMTWRFIKRRHPERILPNSCYNIWEEKIFRKVMRWSLNIVVGVVAVAYTVIYTLMDNPGNLMSLSGIVVFFTILYTTSTNRSAINWHTIYWGFLLQIIMGIFIVRSEVGISVMIYIRDRFSEFLSYSDTGAAFVFSEKYVEFNFIFRNLPHVLFYLTMINVLTYLGVISFIVRTIGNFMAFCLGTGAVESVVAASNIFMGSVPIEYLLSAALMSAPAALVCAKLNMPNVQVPVDDKIVKYQRNPKERENAPRNVLEAITKGTQIGTMIVTTIAANTLIYLSLTDFLNATLTWFGYRVDVPDITFEKICSYLLWPFAFIMGVPKEDCPEVGRFLGVRALTNAGIAYIQMGKYLDNKEQLTIYESSFNDSILMNNGDIFLPNWNTTLENGILTERTALIGTYALCGFSSLPAMGLSLGVFGSIFPHRLQDVSRIILRAFIVSTIASYVTACIAGNHFTLNF